MKLLRSFLFLIFVLQTAAFAQQKQTPRFADYPVKEVYKGANAKLRLTKADRSYRTRLGYAAKEKPNFAGHYVLTAWGCGTECLMGAVIDVKTGKVYWWDFTICCWEHYNDEKFEPIEFRKNSSLIVFSGLRGEKEGDRGAHFYKFANGKFVHLKTVSE